MKIIRAMVWSEEIIPDMRRGALVDDVIVIRSRDVFLVTSESESGAVKEFQKSLGKLRTLRRHA